MTQPVLASTLHDPRASMLDQILRVLPSLQTIFPAITVRTSSTTHPDMIHVLRTAGITVDDRPAPAGDGHKLGLARSQAVSLALQNTSPFILYCDFDRTLHWAEHYPAELAETGERIQEFDFTVLGRTGHAWQTHPRVQRDTEAIINHVFQLITNLDWDVCSGARGLSRRAAQALLSGCKDENLSTDVSWPLYLRSLTSSNFGYTQTCILTEGLGFETQDRHSPEVQAAGGLDAWLNQFDADPQRWLERLELAAGHLRAMLQFVDKPADNS
ncbi:MAG: hypothetical protein LLG42_10615 [Chloroflexi bacterium]|nr:hypothetical protein [Chloroflexota bacterium]